MYSFCLHTRVFVKIQKQYVIFGAKGITQVKNILATFRFILESVSYTHLDVYKRQVYVQVIRGNDLGAYCASVD